MNTLTKVTAEDRKTRQLGSEAEDESTSESPAGRNIIVAIGINHYQHQPQLDNPINDAQAVLRLFKECGFQELPGVPSLIADDATRAAMAALPYQLAAELTADDNLVIFFAGHGEKRETQPPDPAQPGKTYTHRTGYLIPVDGPKDNPGDWINLDAFLDEISSLPARHIFVILDACKSGIALAEKFKVKGGDQPTTVAALRRLPSRRVMTSAMHDEKAAEGGSGSGHSVFAEALIAAVQDRQADKDGDGYIKTVDLFSFVQDRVSDRAKKWFNLKQTPDYGYLPGDGSGDLVISLREGAFNRLIQEALWAMLRHDVSRLEGLVAQLVAVNPTYPMTLYLQFRLKFMQGDIDAAVHLVSNLQRQYLRSGTLPLSLWDLRELGPQLESYSALLAMPTGSSPIALDLLTGCGAEAQERAPVMPCPAGDAYQIENGSRARFQVTNLSDAPVHLSFVTITPAGRLLVGPLLKRTGRHVPWLEPHGTGQGRQFLVKGLPGSVIETRVFCSAELLWQLMSPPTAVSVVGIAIPEYVDIDALGEVQMVTIWYQISGKETSGPIDIGAIV